MIDLDEVRALAEAARADTGDGLTAREQLADTVVQLLDMLGAPSTQWAASYRTHLGSGIIPRDGEQDAREFIASLPDHARGYWRVVARSVYRHETPWQVVDE